MPSSVSCSVSLTDFLPGYVPVDDKSSKNLIDSATGSSLGSFLHSSGNKCVPLLHTGPLIKSTGHTQRVILMIKLSQFPCKPGGGAVKTLQKNVTVDTGG